LLRGAGFVMESFVVDLLNGEHRLILNPDSVTDFAKQITKKI